MTSLFRNGMPFNLSRAMVCLLIAMGVAYAAKALGAQVGYGLPMGFIHIFDARWGLVSPQFVELLRPALASEFAWPLMGWLTHIFVHGSVWHLLGNAIGLVSFGRQYEELAGSAKFLVVFFASALVGAMAEFYLNYNQFSVLIGASGGVAGLIGAAFFFTNPRAKLMIYMVIPVPIRLGIVVAVALHVVLFVVNVPGIAWMAHLGGLATGAILGVWLFAPTQAVAIWRAGLNWRTWY